MSRQYIDFEGGPLDGQSVRVELDEMPVGSILFCFPTKGPKDTDDLWTSQSIHEYTLIHTTDCTEIEGAGISHCFGHTLSAIRSIQEVDEFLKRRPLSAEDQKFLDDLRQAARNQ